jgi:GPH family glycoside/pentoside/hexuronide:cation symporter
MGHTRLAMPASPANVQRVSGLLIYAAPVVASTFLMSPASTVLAGIYGKYFGVPLTTLALLTLLVRLADGVSDPLLGYFSDRRNEQVGSRFSFIIVGGILMSISAWFLFRPLSEVGAWWFGIWFLILYIGWSAFEISHNAWGAELARGYAERARLYGFRGFAFYVGGLLFYAVPMLPLFGSHAFTPRVLQVCAGAGSAFLGITLVLASRLPRGVPTSVPERESTLRLFRSVTGNRPLVLFLIAYFLAGLSFGMWGGILYVVVDVYLKLGDRLAVVFLIGTPVGMLCIPIWSRVMARYGKREVWLISAGGLAVTLASGAMLSPGPNAFGALVALTVALYAFSACLAVVAPAILADIADYGRWKFGRDRAGSYYAALSVTAKATTGLGASASLGVAGLLGFDPTAHEFPVGAIHGLRIAFAVAPSLCVAASLPLIWGLPINPHRLDILQNRLKRRDARAATTMTSRSSP